MFQVKIRCGEIYHFNLVKSITDVGDGTLEIVGNFKPRGRYKNVRIWKNSILNLEEINRTFEISLKPYFCLKCKREHRSGDIFHKHFEFIGKKEDLIPCNRIIEADTTKLRDIAQRQLVSLLKRMKMNPQKSDLYRREINKLFIYEGVALEEILPKDD